MRNPRVMSMEKPKAFADAKQLLGFSPEHNAELALALEVAWQVGYRTPEGLRDFAGKLLDLKPQTPPPDTHRPGGQ